jgi:hypothetical protein
MSTSWRLMLLRKKTSTKAMAALMAYLSRTKKVVYQPWPKVWSPERVRRVRQAREEDVPGIMVACSVGTMTNQWIAAEASGKVFAAV